jgi:hypothetical protein
VFVSRPVHCPGICNQRDDNNHVRLEVVSDLLQAHQSLKMREGTRADVIYLHKENVTSC